MGTNNLKLILQLYKGKWCIGVGIGQYICVKWWYMGHTKLIWITFLKIKWSECPGEMVMSFPVRITTNSWSSEKFIIENRRLFYPPSDDILTHFCTLFTFMMFMFIKPMQNNKQKYGKLHTRVQSRMSGWRVKFKYQILHCKLFY